MNDPLRIIVSTVYRFGRLTVTCWHWRVGFSWWSRHIPSNNKFLVLWKEKYPTPWFSRTVWRQAIYENGEVTTEYYADGWRLIRANFWTPKEAP